MLSALGYEADSRLLNSSDFGVPQLRPRWIMVAMRRPLMEHFEWPAPLPIRRTVGGSLRRLMAQEGWAGAAAWAERAREIAPTIVGGSRKHGGADLGPTRAKKRWTELGVDGMGIANRAPGPDFPPEGHPRLTIEMVARLQGFPASWRFRGRKTSAYRQVGNALPPPGRAARGASCGQHTRSVLPDAAHAAHSADVDGWIAGHDLAWCCRSTPAMGAVSRPLLPMASRERLSTCRCGDPLAENPRTRRGAGLGGAD